MRGQGNAESFPDPGDKAKSLSPRLECARHTARCPCVARDRCLVVAEIATLSSDRRQLAVIAVVYQTIEINTRILGMC